MKTKITVHTIEPDPAAILGAGASLLSVFEAAAKSGRVRMNLSDDYDGGDEFMRQCMRVATEFETWACARVDFDRLDDVWPYLLQDQFGDACLYVLVNTPLAVRSLLAFGPAEYAIIARTLKLKLKK